MKKIMIAVLGLTLLFSAAACQRNNNGAPDQASPGGGAGASPGGGAGASPGGGGGASPGGSPGGSPSPAPTGTKGTVGDTTVDAQAVYQHQCIACHAADLHGGVGPNLQKVGGRLSADQIAARISNGGNGMTAFKGILTDAQIHALADWLSGHK